MWADQLVEGMVHPSPGLVVLVLAVILSGKTAEVALVVMLVAGLT